MFAWRGGFASNAAFNLGIVLFAFLTTPGCASMTGRSSDLESEVRRLREQVEELQKRQAETQVRLQELRERLSAPPQPAPVASADPAAPPLAAPVEKPPAGSSPHQMYNSAFTQYNLGRHPEAIQLFQAFIAAYPRHGLADNARYWIGECHYARKEFEAAAEEFQQVVDVYPQGNKVPDAIVKKGLALLALDRRDEAVEALRTVIETYPKSDAATHARQRLSEIQRGGRSSTQR
jgi:tol-pal system protein YbgF